MTEVTLFVISDIHAFSENYLKPGDKPPSYLHLALSEDIPGENPFADLLRFIGKRRLTADALVCCGDIGDRAQPEAVTFAWQWLKRIRKALGEDCQLYVTSGNHDLDSRYKYNDFDARGNLLGLEDYPFSDAASNNEYWSRSAVLRKMTNYNILVVNSAAYHGHQEQEWEHGRISKRTVSYIAKILEDAEIRSDLRPNILICHHHLYRYGCIDLSDYSEMTDGSTLLEVLGSGRVGRWLVIHGHRHWPNLEYASGGGGSPIVFAAGSFSAVLYDELQDKARNQCYRIVVEGPSPLSGHSLRGRFEAWDWISGSGWDAAGQRSGLPSSGGFGSRCGGDAIAQQIAQLFRGNQPYIPWDELCAAIPDLPYISPADQAICVESLELLGLRVLEHKGQPMQVGRP